MINTNRLKYQNVSTSWSLPQVSNAVGYTTIKASKGTASPVYLPPGQNSAINALQWLGTPSATNPGVQQVIDYLNSGYGVWVSAPSSSSSTVPSYFGASYLTSLGSLETAYQVTEDLDGSPVFAYNASIAIQGTTGSSSPFLKGAVVGSTSTSISVTAINTTYINSASLGNVPFGNVVFTFPRNDGTTATIYTTLVGTNLVAYALSGSIVPLGGVTYASGTLLTPNMYSLNSQLNTPMTLTPVTVGSISGTTVTFSGSSGSYYDSVYQTVQDLLSASLTSYGLIANLSSISVGFVFSIQNYAIMGIFQSSPRQVNPGYLTLQSLNVNNPTIPSYNTATFAYTEATYSCNVYTNTFTVSTSPTGIDSTGSNIYANNIMGIGTNNFLSAQVFTGRNFTDSAIYAPWPQGAVSSFTITGTSSVGLATTTGSATAYLYGYNSAILSTTVLAGMVISGAGSNVTAGTVVNGISVNGSIATLTLSSVATGTTTTPYSSVTFTTPAQLSTALIGQRGTSNTTYFTNNINSQAVEVTVLTAGWALANDSTFLSVNIFFDSNGDASIANTFKSMRAGFNKTATYISPIKVSTPAGVTATIATTATTAIINARASLPYTTGLAYYCNEVWFQEQYNLTSYWHVPIGAIAGMLSTIMDVKLGGVGPYWTNEGNPGLGGQIGVPASKQKYNFSANDLDNLDSATVNPIVRAVNPIVRDLNLGVFLASQRTAQSPQTLNDWSYLGHSMAFDLLYREITNAVMIPQIGKLIDPAHINIRTEQTQSILNKRTSGATNIWDSTLVEISQVNNASTMAQNNFMILVRVKVYPFSEWVTLSFDDVAQSSTVAQG